MYDKEHNVIGFLFTGCQINMVNEYDNCYETETGNFVMKNEKGVKWFIYPCEGTNVGTLIRDGGILEEYVFIEILRKQLGYDVIKLPTGTPYADMIATKGAKKFLIQLKTHLLENSDIEKLDKKHINELIKLAKDTGFIPLLIHYFPHMAYLDVTNLQNNTKIAL